MSKRTRVKCANCGTVYDLIEPEKFEAQWGANKCPKCDSNAYDPLQNQPKHLQKDKK